MHTLVFHSTFENQHHNLTYLHSPILLAYRIQITRRGDYKDINDRQQLLKLATSVLERLAMIIPCNCTALAFQIAPWSKNLEYDV